MENYKLRGKKLNIMKPQTNYAKVPIEVLCHPDLTPIDKIIIAYLFSHSDSGKYILAYTRIAKELKISKKWVIERWKWLKEHKYILEDDKNYYVSFGIDESKLKELKRKEGIKNGNTVGEVDTPSFDAKIVEGDLPKVKPEGEDSTPLSDNSKEKLKHPLDEENSPIKVNKLSLNGELATPNEHNKEEKRKTEQVVECGNLSPEGKSKDYIPVNKQSPSSNTNTSNDLEFLIENSGIFKSTYDNNTSKGNNWNGIDISAYSNDLIAHYISQRVKGELIDIPRNIQNMLTIMVKFSQKFPDCNLWKSFLYQIENNENYIQKLNEL